MKCKKEEIEAKVNEAFELVMKGRLCAYCFKRTEHVPDSEIYGNGGYGGMIYLCRPCIAYVGCHKSSPMDSLGRVANKELREAKIEAHYFFDYLWRKKMAKGFKKNQARSSAYKWLAKEMNIESEKCHIGMFNVAQCKRVVELCKPYKK